MKIIVPIQGKTEEDCLRTVRLLAAHRYFPYVYAIELRYDLLTNRSETLSDFLQEIRKLIGQKKLIFTIRTDRQGGAFPFGKSYFQLNLLAMESGVPDYIDLEVETGEEGRGPWKECIAMVQHLGGKVIASYHDFQKTPSIEEGEEILDRLSSYPVEVVKMAVMPRTKEDVLNAMLSGRRWKDRHGKTELIVMSMGEMGRASRVLGDLSGSAYSFVQVFTASAPGQWEIGEYLSTVGKLRGKNSVAFLGFMGSGKSTLAPRIAALSGKEFFEMDALLEKKFGVPISAFFHKYGEERFRKEEAKLLHTLSSEKMILSPGGGVVLREENRKQLKEHFFTIYLRVRPETVVERLYKGENVRPLLQGKMNRQAIGEMMAERSALYEETADYILDGDGKTVANCVEELRRVLQENGMLLP